MNVLKKLAVAAALAIVGVTGAQATEYGGTLTPVTMVNTTGGGVLWTFSDADFVQDRSAGNDFADYFLLNVPDDEIVTFFVASSPLLSSPTVSFSYYDLSVFLGDDIDNDFATGNPVIYSLEGNTYELTSGLYELDVYGSFVTDGGSFEGAFYGTPAVPEPTGMALLLAGLGAIGTIARRRCKTKG